MTMNLFALYLFSCANPDAKQARMEPTFIEVSGSIESAEGDSATSTFEYTNTTRTVSLSGTTLDRNAEPYDYNGWVEISIRPGVIADVKGAIQIEDSWGKTHWYIQATDGRVETELQVASIFGDTRAWITATADPNDPKSKGSLATGVTERIDVQLPTIQQLQDVSEINDEEPYTTSPLSGEFVTIRTQDRQVVVTEMDTKGFWVSDLGHIDEDPASVSDDYRGLFIYTFNAPEGIAVGDRLDDLAGGVQEYIGTTQISFPDYSALDGQTLPVPGPVNLDTYISQTGPLCDSNGRLNHNILEAFESGLVKIEDATIPENFQDMGPGQNSHPDYASYLEYGQWPVQMQNGCTILVVSNIAVPGFDPVANAGTTVEEISGMLKFVEAGGDRWVIQVANANGMPFVEINPTAAVQSSPKRSHWQRQHPNAHAPLCSHDHVGDHLRPQKD